MQELSDFEIPLKVELAFSSGKRMPYRTSRMSRTF